jgi:hypothetical protein
MKTHLDIDRRSLALARAIAERIDQDPERRGLRKAQAVCAHWTQAVPQPIVEEWRRLLEKDWPVIREVLLSTDETGCRLRQSSPFCGILSPIERWRLYRELNHEPRAT